MLLSREYEPWDKPALIHMGRLYTQEIGSDFCEEAFVAHLDKMIDNGKLFVVEIDLEIAGVICVVPMCNPFNGKSHLLRSDLFVRKDYRHKGVAYSLNKAALTYGKSIGIEEYSWA